MNCKDYIPPQNHLKCIVHVKSKDRNCFYDGVHLLSAQPLKNKNRPLCVVESPFYWRGYFVENNNSVREFEKNNPGYLVVLWKPDRDLFKISYMNKKFKELRHNSTIFQFIYHEGHYSAITMLMAFYKFIFKPTGRKKVYPCLPCMKIFYNEDELQNHYLYCN